MSTEATITSRFSVVGTMYKSDGTPARWANLYFRPMMSGAVVDVDPSQDWVAVGSTVSTKTTANGSFNITLNALPEGGHYRFECSVPGIETFTFPSGLPGDVLQWDNLYRDNRGVPAASPVSPIVRGLSAFEEWQTQPGNENGTMEDFYAAIAKYVVDGTTSAELQAHIEAAEPHPAYDRDVPDLTVLLENRLA